MIKNVFNYCKTLSYQKSFVKQDLIVHHIKVNILLKGLNKFFIIIIIIIIIIGL